MEIIIMGIIIILSWWVIYAKIKKEIKYLNIISRQNNYIESYKINVNNALNKLNEIDSKGLFKSDDEVGFFFNNLKEIHEELDKYDTE